MFEDGLEIALLSNLLEKRLPDLGIVDWNVTWPEQRPASCCLMGSPQACREEAQRTAGTLEIRDGGPPLAHEVHQCRVERVGDQGLFREQQFPPRPKNARTAPLPH